MPIICTRAAASTRFTGHLGSAQDQVPLQARLSRTFTTPGRYTWIVPEGVTSISVLAVGAGGGGGAISTNPSYVTQSVNGGGGGGYAYMYNYPVTPGDAYTVQVGAGGRTAERLGTVYWDTADDGIRSDNAEYSTTKGSGGIASWFGNASLCRGGGGMNGNASLSLGSITYTGNAFGGYYTVGSGAIGGGRHGGMGANVYAIGSGSYKIGGGGGAGSAANANDSTGRGSFDGMSRGAGASGGGAGGGAGSRNGRTTSDSPASIATGDGSWQAFQSTYAIWPSVTPTPDPNIAWFFRTYTATVAGTYTMKATADNKADIFVDNVLITTVENNFNVGSPPAVSFTLGVGTHVIKIHAVNTESYAGVAVAIYNPSGTLVWDTRSTRTATLSGYYGVTPGGQGGGIGLEGISYDSGSGGGGGAGLDAALGVDTSGANVLLYGGTIYDGVSSLYTRTSGFWGTFQNTYAVWPTPYDEVGSFTIYREFTAASTGTYYVNVTADNHANVIIDNSVVASADDNFNSTPTNVAVTLSSGLHVIQLNVKNNDFIAGVAMTITNSANVVVWDTASTRNTVPTGSRYLTTSGGKGGSGGSTGKGALTGWLGTAPNAGSYGGGGGGAGTLASGFGSSSGQPGAHGAVRIMWEPGSAYPNTNTATYY